ncbi:MAG: hypothetical protein SFW36_10910 [Leptolyngbyaceae cyanobacterium bins.59]|nr:hypothetical protein [Leptolyngbyaceae cyanobacterium bins.59]
MNVKASAQTTLELILIASIVSTAIHFTDNYRFIELYPQPAWITAPSIYQSWIILTLIGMIGYWLYRSRKFWFAYLCLGIYSLTGLASPGHYLYGSWSQFSFKMHLFIWTDAITSLAVLGFVVWSLLFLKEWQPTEP